MIVGKTASGKTALARKLMDEWLMEHPGKKAHILDPKDRRKDTVRWFEPHKQIEQVKQ
jgi:molybdopterin-guanine dinucleotide biosynthesis protein